MDSNHFLKFISIIFSFVGFYFCFCTEARAEIFPASHGSDGCQQITQRFEQTLIASVVTGASDTRIDKLFPLNDLLPNQIGLAPRNLGHHEWPPVFFFARTRYFYIRSGLSPPHTTS